MRTILVTSSRGVKSQDLHVMRHSLNKAFPHAKVVTIAPHIDDRWGSLRVTDPYNGQSIEKIATDFYSIKNGSVADVIYHAIQSREDYV